MAYRFWSVTVFFSLFASASWANSPPTGNPDAYTYDEGTTNHEDASTGVLQNDSDADNDGLMASLVDDVENGTLTLNPNGSFTYEHNGSPTLSDSFTYRANDGTANSAITAVSITINNAAPTADAPVVSPASPNASDDLTATTSNLADGDGDPTTLNLDWREDNTSIALLNLSFDTREDALTTGAIRDYSTHLNHGTLGGSLRRAGRWDISPSAHVDRKRCCRRRF